MRLSVVHGDAALSEVVLSRRSWLAVALILLTVACTSPPEPAPAPSPTAPVAGSTGSDEPVGLRVAVVLPPPGQAPLTPAGTRLAAESVADRYGTAVGEFRTVAPDDVTFVEDVVVLLAEQGYHLVCVVGRGAAEVVLEVAPTFPATRFCGIPAPGLVDPQLLPPNALLVDLRMEEAAYLAGVAAATAPRRPSPSVTEGAAPAPAAGFVTAPGPETDRLRAAFVAGVTALQGARAGAAVATGATTTEALGELVRAQFESGVQVVYVATGVRDGPAIEAAGAHDGYLVLLRDRARFAGDTPTSVVTWMLVDVSGALGLAVGRVVDGGEGGLVSLGVAEGAIRPQVGAAEGSTATFERVRRVAEELGDGSRTVPEP